MPVRHRSEADEMNPCGAKEWSTVQSGEESVVQKLPAVNDSPGMAPCLNSQVLAAPASENGDAEDDLFGDVREGDAIDLRHEVSDGEAEDATPKKIAADPGKPSQLEVEEHEVDHYPYRTWCEECVKGRGTGEPHRSVAGERHAIFAFDYLYLTKGLNGLEVVTRENVSKDIESTMPPATSASYTDEIAPRKRCVKVLVAKDLKSGSVFAHVVLQKGLDADGYAVARIVEDIKWLGYTKLLVKSDNEPAIVALCNEALRRLRIEGISQASREGPPAYDSSSNGAVEAAVKAVQGLLRTVKLGFERKTNCVVPEEHPLLAWMVEHVGWILTTRARRTDGRTGFHHVRGRPFHKRQVEIFEQCLHKLPTKGLLRDAQAKLGERWRRGVFLGVDRTTSEYLLWDDGVIVSARAIQRLRAQFRWPQEEYNKIVSGPRGLYAAEEPECIENAGPAPVPLDAEQDRSTRSFQIRMADWLEHGSTPGCQKCNTARDLGWSFAGGQHSKACVERYRNIFSGSEAGRLRLERAAKRLGARDPASEAQRSAAAQVESRPLLLRQLEVIRSEREPLRSEREPLPRQPDVIRSEAAAGDDEYMRDMEPTDAED